MNHTIVWFRRDLRICDHAPLYRAARRGAVIPVFVFDRALLHHPETAVARVAFMLQCVQSLDRDLRQLGGRLILRSGDPVHILCELIRETEAEGIYAYIDYERIYGRVRDARLNQGLAAENLKIRWFEPAAGLGDLIAYPEYRQFWFQEMEVQQVPTPSRIVVPENVASLPLPTLNDLGLSPDDKPIPPAGTTAARQFLQDFLMHKHDRYYWQLSYPSAEATTGLSPHIKFGAISVRECYQTVQEVLKDSNDQRVQWTRKQLISRLRWGVGFGQRFRYLPQLELRSLYQVFDEEGSVFDESLYELWQKGETGFPIVDAAARCLQATGGWLGLNFRSRAMYASFLSNLLGIDWRYGALHFMRHLIDGDCPIDHYQWAMQSGVTHCVDKTWTRIYNPQQLAIDRCDPEGTFIKYWIPELAHLSPGQLGAPPPTPGYPLPIINYKQARAKRVTQLQHQRTPFLGQQNVVPFLARMPQDWTPWGHDRFPSDVNWVSADNLDLFPPPLNLDTLAEPDTHVLRSWFVSHINIQPHQGFARKQKSTKRTSRIQNIEQLSLL